MKKYSTKEQLNGLRCPDCGSEEKQPVAFGVFNLLILARCLKCNKSYTPKESAESIKLSKKYQDGLSKA